MDSMKEDVQESQNDVLQVKMDMKGKTRKMFLALKEYYNLGFNSEMIRVLIKERHRELFDNTK